MTFVRRLVSIIRWITCRNRAERDLHDEMQGFVEMAAADQIRDGATPGDARRWAVLHLGGVEQTKERVRSARCGVWIEDIVRDLRYALRACVRQPALSTVVVTTLALGIGANTAVFSVVDAVLLRPLTYRQPDRLVVLHERLPDRGRVPVGAFEFEGWRDTAQSFDQMALIAVAPVILTGAGNPVRLDAARASASLFPLLGVNAAIGRTFGPEEDIVGRDRVVLLSDELWRGRFAADPAIVGRHIRLNEKSYVVTGVLPPRFRFPRLEQLFVMGITGGQPQLWMPFAITDSDRGENSFAMIARLRRGVSIEQAQAETGAILSQLVRQIPNPPRVDAEIVPLQEQITAASQNVLALLWASIFVVLLIACGNIASLLVARALARAPELALRRALGASRRTLIRHSLIDTMTLAVIGGILGVLLATWLLPILVHFAPSSVPRLDEVAINQRAVVFALVVTIVTGALVGVLPTRRASHAGFHEGLRLTGRSETGGRRDRATQGVVVIVQTALTVGCLGACGLVTQSLLNVLKVDAGFQADRVLTMDVSLSPGRYGAPDAHARFTRNAVQRLQAIPGVTAVGFVNKLPLTGISVNSVVVLEGTERAAIAMVDRPQADVRTVDAAYFGTLAIPLLRGELFQEGEHRSVAVVSAALADRAWPGERALGKRFRLTFRPQTVLEVVGVVGDVRNMGLETRPTATVYLPHWQAALSGASFVVKTASDPITVATAARVAMSDLDDDVPIDAVRTMQTVVGDSVATRSFQAGLLSLFGAIALALSGIAVFGVMSYAVAQRARELGLRLALGATPRSLQRMIVGQTLRLVGTGVALGAPLAVLAGYLLRDVLFGVRPQDIRTLLFSVTVIVLVALVAGWLPARRAARNNPIATLRAQ